MIEVMVGGQTLKITPKRLLDYCEKIDFIKMRRGNPATLVEGFPEGMTEANYKIMVKMAMETVIQNASSVSVQEEIAFDTSEEGFFYNMWRCMPKPAAKKIKGQMVGESWRDGVNRAKRLWDSGTKEEKTALLNAMNSVDETSLLKNSSGPSEPLSPPGQTEPSVSP